MEIELCNPAEQIPNVRALLESNWAETGFDFPFSPCVESYRKMYELGFCFALLAKYKEKPVGYCSVTIVPHPHNPAVIVAGNDALFVDQKYRRGTLTARIMKAAEQEATRRGAHRFTWHCRAGTGFAETLERHGYMPVDVVVMKGLYGD